MTSLDKIREVFSIFHDGTICSGSLEGSTVELEIDIEYLAERINPDYRCFKVVLHDVSALKFAPWVDKNDEQIPVIIDLCVIASLDLGILSAETKDDYIQVYCTQDCHVTRFSGGVISFSASGIRVFDESGTEWSVETLGKLCEGYWDDWEQKNKK